ncbi:MAG: SIR2 family protein [Panacagrimonas sp.]
MIPIMTRKILIFGNGLGMALDQDFFPLDRSIGNVWDSGDLLDDASKKLICDCLPQDNNDRPHGENDLDVLQLALSASEFLSGLGGSRIHWLSEEGQAFPVAVRKFIYQVALQFHKYEGALPGEFVGALANFLLDTNSHVATLNYDNLLYQPLIEREVLKGYSGALVDGFHNSGFKAENLERKFGRTFGYYLHLHGSPLFVDRNDNVLKLHQCELAEKDDVVSSHIVLTHFKHKPTVISASELLTAYWRKLAEAISESAEIVVVGYGGDDEHLNSLLHNASRVPVRIVEWDGAGEQEQRVNYWSSVLAREITLVRRASILEFQDWYGDG